MTVAVPLATAVTRPVDDTVATASSDVAHVTVAPAITVPFWSLTVTVSWAVAVSEAKLSSDPVKEPGPDNSTVVATGVGAGVDVSVLGPVVLSPVQAVNSKATPTIFLYLYTAQSHGQGVSSIR